MEKYHRAFGVYGFYLEHDRLLVMKKNGGPYKNRYDLPGGSLEDGEALAHCLYREYLEETGRRIQQAQQVGTYSFTYPWNYQTWHHNQHICVFYHVTALVAEQAAAVTAFAGQDSLGAAWVPLKELTPANASPLVLKACEFYLAPEKFLVHDVHYKTWDVLTQPVFA
ncbi:NUDIX hydrolase [Enterococcus nangangensis]|uniref:NUDIX hydrolase n=1 Tax=Enterococcus nangangensis TaxID=2559926 RepID=UPI0010F9D94B|nr:NUDIX hydrolase [Enterococcus nangangensis]